MKNKIVSLGSRCWLHFVILGVIFTAVWLAYKDCLSAAFQLDDGIRILNNAPVHLKEWSFKGWIESGLEAHARRPVAMLTFSLTYLFFTLKPYYYRLGNVLIHMVSCGFLYYMFAVTFNKVAKGENREYSRNFILGAAFFAVLIWALHPVQTSSVTYIIQRICNAGFISHFLVYTQALHVVI